MGKKQIEVSCECKGTGFIAVADSGGDGIDHVECGQHHPAFQDKLIIMDEVRTLNGTTGYVVGFDGKGNVLIGGTNILGVYSRTWYPKTQLIKID
jgi:hypothetical protein